MDSLHKLGVSDRTLINVLYQRHSNCFLCVHWCVQAEIGSDGPHMQKSQID